MTDSRHTPNPDDEVLIQHFRPHTSGEPPASLDAFLLATARREAPAPQPNLWQRWLLACQRPRWQMAFATVAGVALMIGLVVRSPVPNADLPAPAAAQYSASREELARPAPQALQAPAPPMTRLAMAPQADSVQVQAEVAGAMADESVAKMSKRMAVKPQSLEQGLQEIVRLRQAGEAKAADEKLLALYKRFPQEDLPTRLEALQKP
ncbi:hypothetical protein FQ186_21680 [Pseudomonas sp. ANT_H14]|uniref:hypothetical protein n=1 Tax=unclassified Pseudomonas TaxID=196821 RepID=UPI0011F051A0|nr:MULTISPECIES: hypothetical protein [unclassified Pseudomonas]KAA0945244.1 hypothetical protein FQ182_18580 [Pseudomonas sp. ANT_H4]KAA0949960.1 hypothetical protein FQ186_21680 [Pseudomonas sp. ANT_H14]